MVTQQKPQRCELWGFLSVMAGWISPQADYYIAEMKSARKCLAAPTAEASLW